MLLTTARSYRRRIGQAGWQPASTTQVRDEIQSMVEARVTSSGRIVRRGREEEEDEEDEDGEEEELAASAASAASAVAEEGSRQVATTASNLSPMTSWRVSSRPRPGGDGGVFFLSRGG